MKEQSNSIPDDRAIATFSRNQLQRKFYMLLFKIGTVGHLSGIFEPTMQTKKLFLVALIMGFFYWTQAFAADRVHMTTIGPQVIDIKLGLMFRFDDKYNKTTEDLVRGIETAVAMYQKRHNGVAVSVVKFAHSKKIDEIIATAKEMTTKGLSAVIGGETSNEAMAMAEVFNSAQTVFITPTSTNPDVTAGRPFVFRGCIVDDEVARKLAQFSSNYFKSASFGVLHNISYPYSDFLSVNFTSELRKTLQSGADIHVEKVVREHNDFSQQIARFKAKGITHIAMLTYNGDLQRFFSQAAAQGYFPQYIGSDGWGSPQGVYDAIVAKEKHGSKFVGYVNSYWNAEQSSKFGVDFRQTYFRMHKLEPTPWSAIAFDTAWVLLDSIRRASGAKGSKLSESLKATDLKNLITSKHFIFGPNNTPLKNVFMYKISSSGTQFLTTK
jgi:branched-chain amino acid transport system substrate-binding protein